jgi:uncharacterized OsmC-like protein
MNDMPENMINGVDLAALGEIMSDFRADPKTAAFEFRSSTDWQSGAVVNSNFTGHTRSGVDNARAKPHQLAGDEPVALLGSGKHVGPAGHLLHAMCHCLTVTTAYHGAARGVKIDSLRVDAEGSLDLQGFLGLNDKVKPGFKQIHLKAYVDSPNSPEEVLALFQYAQGRSPICSTVRHDVNLSWEFDIEASGAGPDTGEDRHGVNFPNLAATVQAVRETPVLARCKFFTSTEWLGGAKIRSSHPGFDQAEGELLMHHRDESPKAYVGDEPVALLGSDTGPSPSETLLHAMANCVSVTTSYHSAARGIPLDAFNVNLQGDMDLQGFADLDDNVTPAYQTIRAKVRIKTGGKASDIAELLKFTTSHSPMCDSVSRPVDVSFSLVHNGIAIS